MRSDALGTVMLMRVGGEKKEKTNVAVPAVCMSSFCQLTWGKNTDPYHQNRYSIRPPQSGAGIWRPVPSSGLPFPHLIKYHMWDKSLAGGGTEAAAEYIVLFFILFS